MLNWRKLVPFVQEMLNWLILFRKCDSRRSCWKTVVLLRFHVRFKKIIFYFWKFIYFCLFKIRIFCVVVSFDWALNYSLRMIYGIALQYGAKQRCDWFKTLQKLIKKSGRKILMELLQNLVNIWATNLPLSDATGQNRQNLAHQSFLKTEPTKHTSSKKRAQYLGIYSAEMQNVTDMTD